MRISLSGIAVPALALSLQAVPTFAAAPQVEQRDYDLPSQPLSDSLRAVAQQSGTSIVAPSELVAGKRAPAVSGRRDIAAAVTALLAGSGLRLRRVGIGFIVERDDPPAQGAGGDSGSVNDILVTGSRLRNAPIASPVIAVTRDQIRNAGQASLGEVVQAIPQNFGGGQNPGVGSNVPVASGVNVGGGSSVNLRGLGSDATLTLLNGRRLAYSSSRQGIDLSAIPIIAVERVEVVADGASAIYGSDAVAGVVNILLLRDHDGVETRARLGASTQGGNVQQQYSALAGTVWTSGGGFVAYEFAHSTPIISNDRAYARVRPGVTLLPALKHHNAVASLHQAITSGLSLQVDGLYNRRFTDRTVPSNAAGNPDISRTVSSANSQSFAVAPSLELTLGGGWRLGASATYGEDRVRFTGETFVGAVRTSSAGGCYCNVARSVELSGDGTLFSLPGGDAKLAIGGGYRRNDFELFRGAGNIQTISNAQSSRYVYAEAALPLVSPALDIPLVYRLSVSGAVRYESYRSIDDVATPKLGLIYAPTADFDLKASWGRSFRAPTFLQQYQVQTVNLLRATTVGGAGLPADATALYASGGNVALAPEKARSWSMTLAAHPRALPGVKAEISYFDTRYVDRIVSPVTFIAQSLSNPIFAGQVVRRPSAAQQAELIAGAGQFINGVGVAYDPAKVVAIVDNANVNAGRQSLHGLDLQLSYTSRLKGGSDSIAASLSASYLSSEQQLTSGQPVQQLAGLIFNPPHLRARGNVSWTSTPVTVSAAIRRIGGVDDRRFATPQRLSPVTSLDLVLRVRPQFEAPPLRGIELVISALNLLDAEPETIATTAFGDTAFDSANYSSVGRFIGLEVSKKW